MNPEYRPNRIMRPLCYLLILTWSGVAAEFTGATYIASGHFHRLAVRNDGTVWVWGTDYSGSLGISGGGNRCAAVQVPNLDSIKSVAGGWAYSLAVKTDGTLWVWGDNSKGQLGIGPTANYNSPAQHSLTNVSSVAAFNDFTLALKDDQTVWAWGANYNGALGDGSTSQSFFPVQVIGLTNVIAIACGNTHSAALKSDGTVWTWGGNQYGQLGNNTTVNSSVPVQVTGLSNVTAISCGSGSTYALKDDGSLWAFGYNGTGELGNGSTTNSSVPVQVSLGNVSAISDCLAVTSDTKVWMWGIAAAGNTVPQQNPDLTGVNQVAGRRLALKNDGTIWSWGSNTYEEIGNGTTPNNDMPTQVSALNNTIGVSGNGSSTVVLNADQTASALGYNYFGELGDGTQKSRSYPSPVSNLSSVLAISAGDHCLAAKTDGTVWAWGDNSYGVLGTGDTVDSLVPIQVPGLNNVISVRTAIFNSMVLKNDGTVWTWGQNTAGQLGDGTTTNSLTPVQVSGLTGAVKIGGGAGTDYGYLQNFAIKGDGTLWSWGANSQGELGIGTNTYSSIPVQILNLSPVVDVSGGLFFSVAVTHDGTVWSWGDNSDGQLGDGTTLGRNLPAIVPGLNGVISVACGDEHVVALKSDGTVCTWGNNSRGQLGDGSLFSRKTPRAVQGLSGVIAVAAGGNVTYALKGDGSVCAFGENNFGQLGPGTAIYDTPQQVVIGVPVAVPVFNPVAGTYVGPQDIQISSATPGAAIFCTIGSVSPYNRYDDPITISNYSFIRAYAVKEGFENSLIVHAAYDIAVTKPYFSIAEGTYNSPQTVAILCDTPYTDIYYTLDGTSPNPYTSPTAKLYTGPVAISATTTINAYASRKGFVDSDVASATYTIVLPVATPTFSVPSGTYFSAQSVSISCSTEGATIYYTLDGTTPSTTSLQYLDPIYLSETGPLRAFAIKNGNVDSAVASALYVFEIPPSIVSPLKATAVQDQPFFYSVDVDGSAPLTISADGLPGGLILNGKMITGSPSFGGVFLITLSATNSFGTDSKTLELIISKAAGVTNNPPIVSIQNAAPSSLTTAGQSVVLNAIANDADGDTPSYTWDFGDGTQSVGISVTHVFATGGIYTVKVGAFDGTQTTFSFIEVVVSAEGITVGSDNGGDNQWLELPKNAFLIQKAIARISFADESKDVLHLSGTVPVPKFLKPKDKHVVIFLSSVIEEFVLDVKGRANLPTSKFELRSKMKNGVFKATPAKFALMVKQKPLLQYFQPFGLNNENTDPSGKVLTLPIIIVVDGMAYEHDVKVLCKSKAGATASAKLMHAK